jgi:hypothetical protein
MESRNAHARKSLALAFAISLAFHVAVLFFRVLMPEVFSPAGEESFTQPRRRLDISLARPDSLQMVQPPVQPAASKKSSPDSAGKPRAKPEKTPARRTQDSATDVWANKSWSKSERADMDKFLHELDVQARPPSGRELSEKALLAAREMARNSSEKNEDSAIVQQAARLKSIEPFSMTMYFDAFIRKLNRSAAFVKNEPRSKGRGKALVQISLNPDGSLKSFRVLRADDQQSEIAYIKSVIDRAAPFSAFPPDIRNATDSLQILMCILPSQGGGGGFSRTLSGQDC